jgi:hypothetical protein
LTLRRSTFLTILVGIAAAPACSGDEPKAPSSTDCITSRCSDGGRDGGSSEDAGASDDSGPASDGGSIIDGGSTAPDARDATAAVDGGRIDSSGDSGRTPDAGGDSAADNARPADAPSDAPIAEGAPIDATPPGDAPRDGMGGTADGGDLDDILHLNDIQMEGTHNSYHVETTGGIIPAWHYTHKPLDVQLTMQGIRQFELDFHYVGPGDFPVHHVPPDVGTTCNSLPSCLGIMKTWSDAHPRHAPLVVLLEQKDELDATKISGHYDEVDAILLSVWPRERIITPDEVRGQHATLSEAVTTDGWPTLGKTRGRILFAFIGDSTEYMMGHPNLENRVVFPRATTADPFAAFVLLDNAQSSETEITNAVRKGFIVRTRYNGEELKLDTAVTDVAQRGGAQCISGDFPADFTLTGGTPSRCNPVRAPAGCASASVEQL